MSKVELRPAFEWTCEACGRDNYASGIVAEMSEEDRQAMQEEQGIDCDAEGEFMAMPEQVTCGHCGEVFETRHWSEDIE